MAKKIVSKVSNGSNGSKVSKVSKGYSKIAVILVLVAVVALIRGPVSMPVVDSAYYADIAKNLASGNGFQSNFASTSTNPVLPFVLAFFMIVFGGFWAKAFVAACSVALAAAFWILAKEVLSEKKALLALPIFLLFPVIFNVTLDLLSDALFLVFAITSLACYVKMLKARGDGRRFNNLVVAAWIVFAVFAALTRSTGFLLPVIFVVHALVERFGKPFCKAFAPKEKSGSSRWPVKPVNYVVFAIVFAAAFGAWTLFNAQQGGSAPGASYAEKIGGVSRFASVSFSVQDFQKIAGSAGGSVSELNPPISFSITVPLFVSYFLRLVFYLLLFAGPIAILVLIWKKWGLFASWCSCCCNPGNARKTVSADSSDSSDFIVSVDSLLFVWFAVFFVFHVFWPFALSFRYIAPLTVPLAIFFAAKAGGLREEGGWRKKIAWLLIFLQLACCAAVIYWDVGSRWSKSQSAAETFVWSGEQLNRLVPPEGEVYVEGIPFAAVSFYSGRKASNERQSVALISNYEGEPTPKAESWYSSYQLCAESQSGAFYVKIYGAQCD